MSMAPPQGDLTDALRAVHEVYIAKVNAAVEMDRSDLVAELTDAYFAEAQQMITGFRCTVHPEPK